MSKTIISIDVGKHGFIVIRREGFAPDEFHPMPMIKDELDYKTLHDILANYFGVPDTLVIFEKLGVIFGTSKATAFSMGHQAGAVEMLCIALDLPFHKVPPKTWQKELFANTCLVTKKSKSGKSTVTDTKATALIVVKQLFPKLKLTFGDKATKPHDGLIDATLIAEFAKRKNL